MKPYQVPPVNKPVRKPILYWEAYKGNIIIDRSNSIALLRHKYGATAIYKSFR